MNYYLSDFVDYFQNLCVQHPDILHDEASGQRAFEVTAYEEAFSDFRTSGQAKTFFVRFILPSMRWEDQGDNARKVLQMGLMVGRYYSRREDGADEMVQAWSDAERVADDFMARVVADSRNGYALFNSFSDKVSALNVTGDFWQTQGDGSFVAVVYMFEVPTFRCIEADDAPAWLDGGLTT